MRVAVIGCGSIGRRHAQNLAMLGHDLVLYDVNPENADTTARSLNVPIVDVAGSLRAVPAMADAVLICTPAHTHTSVLLQLGDAGYAGPLFVEKPICDTLVDRRYWDAWPHRTTMIGYNLRFHKAARSLRQHVTDPTGGQFFLDCDSRDWPGEYYASMLLECSHEIDLALWCGAPTTLIDMGNYEDDHDINFWLGPSWYVAIRDHMPRYQRQWTLTRRGAEASAFFYAPSELGNEMYVSEIEHFLEAVRDQTVTMTPFADGLRVLDVIEQARRMASE